MKLISGSLNRNNGLHNAYYFYQGLSELTPCEWKLLLHVAADLTNAEIANKLHVTEKSVENYRNRIGVKLNLQGRNKLARFARKHVAELRQ